MQKYWKNNKILKKNLKKLFIEKALFSAEPPLMVKNQLLHLFLGPFPYNKSDWLAHRLANRWKRQTNRMTKRQTNRLINRPTHIDSYIDRHRDPHSDIQVDIQTNWQSVVLKRRTTCYWIDSQVYRPTLRKADLDTCRHISRLMDKQTTYP